MSKDKNLKIILFFLITFISAAGRLTTSNRRNLSSTTTTCDQGLTSVDGFTNKVKYVDSANAIQDVADTLVTIATKADGTDNCCNDSSSSILKYTSDFSLTTASTEFTCEANPTGCLYESTDIEGVFFRTFIANQQTAVYVDFDKVCLPFCPVTTFTNTENSEKHFMIEVSSAGNPSCAECDGTTYDDRTCGLVNIPTNKMIKRAKYTGRSDESSEYGIFLNCKNLSLIAEIKPDSYSLDLTTATAIPTQANLVECVTKTTDHIPIDVKFKKIYRNVDIGNIVDDAYYILNSQLTESNIATNLQNINVFVTGKNAPIFPYARLISINGNAQAESMTFCNGTNQILRTANGGSMLVISFANGNDFETNLMGSFNTAFCSDDPVSTTTNKGCLGADKIYVTNVNNLSDLTDEYIEMPNFCAIDKASLNLIAKLLNGGTAVEIRIIDEFDPKTDEVEGLSIKSADMSFLKGSCPTDTPFTDGEDDSICTNIAKCKKKGTATLKFTSVSSNTCFYEKVCQASTASAAKSLKVELVFDDSYDNKYYAYRQGEAAEAIGSSAFTFTDAKKYELECGIETFSNDDPSHVKAIMISSLTETNFETYLSSHSDETDLFLEVYKNGVKITKCSDIGMFEDTRDASLRIQKCITTEMCEAGTSNAASNGADEAGFMETVEGVERCIPKCNSYKADDSHTHHIQLTYDSSAADESKLTITCNSGKTPSTPGDFYKVLLAHQSTTTFTSNYGTTPEVVTIDCLISGTISDVYINKLDAKDSTTKVTFYGTDPDIVIDAIGAANEDAKKILIGDGDFDILNSDVTTAAACHAKTTSHADPYVVSGADDDDEVLFCTKCTGYEAAPTTNGQKFLLMSYKTGVISEAKVSIECFDFNLGTHGSLFKTTIENATMAGVSVTNNLLKDLNTLSSTNYPDGFTVFLEGSGIRCADISDELFTDKPSFDDDSNNMCLFKANCLDSGYSKLYISSTEKHYCKAACIDINSSLSSNSPISAGDFSDAFECITCDIDSDTYEVKDKATIEADTNKVAGVDYPTGGAEDNYCVGVIPIAFTPPTDETTNYSGFVNGAFISKNFKECWAQNNPNVASNKNLDLLYVDDTASSCSISCKPNTDRITAFASTLTPWNLYCVSNCNNGFPLTFGDKMPFNLAETDLDVVDPAGGGTVADYVADNLQGNANKTLREYLGKSGESISNSNETQFCYFNFEDGSETTDYKTVQCPEGLLKFVDSSSSNNLYCISESECKAKDGGTTQEKTFYKKATFTKTANYEGTQTTGGFSANGSEEATFTFSLCVAKCTDIALDTAMTSYASGQHAFQIDTDGAKATVLTGMFARYTNTASELQECFSNVDDTGALLPADDQKNCFFVTDAVNEKPVYTGTDLIADGDSWCFDKGINFCAAGKKLRNHNKSTVFADFCIDTCAYTATLPEFEDGDNCIVKCDTLSPVKLFRIAKRIGGPPNFTLSCINDLAACKSTTSRTKINLFIKGADLAADIAVYDAAVSPSDDDVKKATLKGADEDSTLVNNKIGIHNLTEATDLSYDTGYEDACIETDFVATDLAAPNDLKIPRFNNKILRIDEDSLYMEFIEESDCDSTGSAPTERLYIVSPTVKYCLTATTCSGVTDAMSPSTIGGKTYCENEASCLGRLDYVNNESGSIVITTLPKKLTVGSNTSCVFSCNAENSDYYSPKPINLTSLLECSNTDASKFGTCTSTNNTATHCLELTEFNASITLTIGSDTWSYVGTDFDYYAAPSTECNQTGASIETATLVNGSKRANVCKPKCSQRSGATDIKKFTYIDGDATSAKDQCLATCSVSADTPGGTSLQYVLATKNVGEDGFENLECIGPDDSANTITTDLICVDAANEANHIITSTETKFDNLVDRGANSTFFPSGYAGTEFYCFEKEIDGAGCVTGGAVHYLEEPSMVSSSSSGKAFKCVANEAACNAIASTTRLVLVNTFEFIEADENVCATSCALYQTSVTGATSSYVLSDETGSLQADATVGSRTCITDKEMIDDQGSFHYFIFNSLTLGSTTEAGITDTGIIAANKLAIKVADTVLACPLSIIFREVVEVGKLFKCWDQCPTEKPVSYEDPDNSGISTCVAACPTASPFLYVISDQDTECLTEDQCYDKDITGTGVNQKIFKPFTDSNGNKFCVSDCPKMANNKMSFPTFKYTAPTTGSPGVVEIGPCISQDFNANYPMVYNFSVSGYGNSTLSLKRGPYGIDQATTPITHNVLYKGQFTDETNKFGCINTSTHLHRSFLKTKGINANVGYECVTLEECITTFEDVTVYITHEIPSPDIIIPFVSIDGTGCVNTCDSTASPRQLVYLKTLGTAGNIGKHKFDLEDDKMQCKTEILGKKVIELSASKMIGFYFYEGQSGIVDYFNFMIMPSEESNYEDANIKFAVVEDEDDVIPYCPITIANKLFTMEDSSNALSCGDLTDCLDNSAILTPTGDSNVNPYVCSQVTTTGCVATNFETAFKVAKYNWDVRYFECVDFASDFTTVNDVANPNKYYIDYLNKDTANSDTISPSTYTWDGEDSESVTISLGTSALLAGADQNDLFSTANTKILFLFERSDTSDLQNADYSTLTDFGGSNAIDTNFKLNDNIYARNGVNLCNYLSSATYKYYRKANADKTEIEHFCNELTDTSDLYKLEVTVTANQSTYPPLVNTVGKEVYVDKYACADLNNNPDGAMFRLYLKAGSEVVCSDIVFSSTTMRRVGNYFYDKTLITGTDYVGCVAENKSTDATNNECLDYMTVLNTEISENITSTDSFTVNSQYQTHISDVKGDNFIEENGKFLKIEPNTSNSTYVTKDQCNTANTILLPDLIERNNKIHTCVLPDSTDAGKEFFKTNATTVFQLEQSDIPDSYVLAEDAPFLRAFGRAKVSGGSTVDKIFYDNKLHLHHGFGASDGDMQSSSQVQIDLSLAAGEQQTFADYSVASTIGTVANQYIIQNLENTGLGETYTFKSSATVPTECENLYIVSEAGEPHKCFQIWSNLTKYAGFLPIDSVFKVEDPAKPRELTIEALVSGEIEEINTKIKFTGANAYETALAATKAGLALTYGSSEFADKYGCLDSTKVSFNILKDGHIFEVCGDETEITATTQTNIINNYIKKIFPSITIV